MNKQIISLFALLLAILLCLTACGENPSDPVSPDLPASESSDSTPEEQTPEEPADSLAPYRLLAISKLDEIVNPTIEKIPEEGLKAALHSFYDTEKQYINGINDMDTAKEAATKVAEDAKAFVISTLKPMAIEKLNGVILPLINAINYEELKTSVETFYGREMAKIAVAETLDGTADLYKEVLDDTKAFIKTETENTLVALKNRALEELDPYVTALIAKIPYESLKTDTQSFYLAEKAKLAAVDMIDRVVPCVSEIKNDLASFALTETKKTAIAELEKTVNDGLAKIPNPDLKKDLSDFSKEEIAKLNAITALENVPATLTSVMTETAEHIKELSARTVREYLARLTAIESATAYDYLPVAMNPAYAGNLVSLSDIDYDFNSFINVSAISKAGFGEQWQMVVENIDQSVAMAKVFNAMQTALNAAGNAVDIYLTNSYADEMTYTYSGEGFNCLFEFKNAKLIFGFSFTSAIELPAIGSVSPIVKMEYDLEKEAKGMFISLGDAYKLKYVISENGYEMATTYGLTIAGKDVSRSAFLSITKNDGKTTGHIYEYTTYEGSDKIQACVDFYVENGFVSVVGNKAAGMVGFDGYINELYLERDGRLLGYEVKEELTVLGVTGTYNTLWFNLWDIQGIQSVRVTDKTKENNSGKSTVDVYLNSATAMLSPTYNSKLGTKTSRKYDVEFRERYYYTYDSENSKYVVEKVLIPMFFVQEGANFDSFVQDMKKDNGIDVSVVLNPTYLNKILTDYDTLIDVFIANKDAMSSEEIIAYLGQYE